jgi:hypothetical protein
MHYYFSQNLLTCHQKFGTYGKGNWIHEKSKFLKFFGGDVSTMCTRLSYNIFQALIRVVGSSLE